jgi:hypothetical protein
MLTLCVHTRRLFLSHQKRMWTETKKMNIKCKRGNKQFRIDANIENEKPEKQILFECLYRKREFQFNFYYLLNIYSSILIALLLT